MAEYQIKWTSRAIKDLRKVYLFNIEFMGEEKSFALVEGLISRVAFFAEKRCVKVGAPDDQFSHFKRN
ncbi:MAG: hypothetical protein RBS53_10730 [Bacteroidales bacterium]|jgi:hypothetical protein|nr:hypothetical protein [Bacteroidales bacterium]NLM92734.1 hypothetical protein [Bacteroidales bacterium]